MSDDDVHAILDSGLLDLDFYAEVSGQANLSPRELVVHYVQIGWLRGLDPSPWFLGVAYLVANPDVLNSGLNPLIHYLGSGRREGRQTFAAIETLEQEQEIVAEMSGDWLEVWDPTTAPSDARILVLVSRHVDPDSCNALRVLSSREDLKIDVRLLASSDRQPTRDRLVQSVLTHSQIASPYEFVILHKVGDPLSEDLIIKLCAQSREFSAPIVGLPIRSTVDNEVILGFRQTSAGGCRPSLHREDSAPFGRSIPTQYVLARSVVLNVAEFASLPTTKSLTWKSACRDFWLRQAPPRVLASLEDHIIVEAPQNKLGDQIFIDSESSCDFDDWFTSSSQSNWPGFQRLRVIGKIGHALPGHPLVNATLAHLEEAGFHLTQTDEAERDQVASETLADVIFKTSHDELVPEVGRRQLVIFLEGVCTCGISRCSKASFRRLQIRSSGTLSASTYWNLMRSLVVSCGNTSGSVRADHYELIRMIIEVGLRPSTSGRSSG